MREVAPRLLPVCFLGCWILQGLQIPTRGNIFAGYSVHMNADADLFRPSPLGGVSANGWEGSVEGKLLPWVGVVARFFGGNSWFRPTTLPPHNPLIVCSRVTARLHTVLFLALGSQSRLGDSRPSSMAYLVCGRVSTPLLASRTQTHHWSEDIDEGFDYKLIKNPSWRVQADGMFTNFFGIHKVVLALLLELCSGSEHLQYSSKVNMRQLRKAGDFLLAR